jgi:hypothetical protein
MRCSKLAILAVLCLLVAGCGSSQGFDGGVRLPESTAEGASWSLDGRWLAIPNKEGVFLRDLEKGGRRQLHAPPMRRHLGSMPGRFGWTPNGNEIHYVTSVGPAEHRGGWITVVPTDGGETRQVALGTSVQATAWPPPAGRSSTPPARTRSPAAGRSGRSPPSGRWAGSILRRACC